MNATLTPSPLQLPTFAMPRKDYIVHFVVGSAILHALLLTAHFSDAGRKQTDLGAKPLQVVLVNAKSRSRPTNAPALAQANLDNGGNTDQKVQATTPFPAVRDTEPQPELTQQLQRVKELEQQQARLLTQVKSPVVLDKPAPVAKPQAQLGQAPDATDLMARSLEMARLEAQIERQHRAYQERPRKKNIGARTEEYRFARYVEDWRMKVERVGNTNYPEEARQKKLYGSLLLSITIKADGSLERVEVDRSSGSKILDEAAKRIVQMASPYAPFPDDIRRDFEIIEITRTWTFTRSDQVSAQ